MPADRIDVWRPPRAIHTVPGVRRASSALSRTASVHFWSRLLDSIDVNSSGMCCTTTTGTGKLGRKRAEKHSARALGPPVDEATTSNSIACGRPIGRAADGGGGGRGRRSRGLGRRMPARSESADLRSELDANALQRVREIRRARGLGDVVVRAARECRECLRRTALGQRAEHDDRQGLVDTPNLAQHLDAVHLRHLDVQEHEIDLAALHDRDRFPTTLDSADVEVGLAL